MPAHAPRNEPIHKRRPAETAAGAAGAIVVILALIGVSVDQSVVVAILGAVAALPAIVTTLVERFKS